MAYWTRRPPASKYHAVPTVVDGRRFASKAEAARYRQLTLLVAAHQITDLTCQPAFPLHATTPTGATTLIGKYVADFAYRDARGVYTVEDVKGVQTDLFRWKRKHTEAEYHLTVTLVSERPRRARATRTRGRVSSPPGPQE